VKGRYLVKKYYTFVHCKSGQVNEKEEWEDVNDMGRAEKSSER
jgi:hypothetical protein